MTFCYFCWRLATDASSATVDKAHRTMRTCRKHSDDGWDLIVGWARRMENRRGGCGVTTAGPIPPGTPPGRPAPPPRKP